MKITKQLIFFILLIFLLPQYLLAAQKVIPNMVKIVVTNSSSEVIKIGKNCIPPKGKFAVPYVDRITTENPQVAHTVTILAKDDSEICAVTQHIGGSTYPESTDPKRCIITSSSMGSVGRAVCVISANGTSGCAFTLAFKVMPKNNDVIIINPENP